MKHENLKTIREYLGLSQDNLGVKLKELSGYGSRQLVAKMEAGNTPIKEHTELAITKLVNEHTPIVALDEFADTLNIVYANKINKVKK